MDLTNVLAELREELAHLDAAILSLKRLQQEGRRRGRPPKALPNRSRPTRTGRHEDAEDPPPAEEED
jgi:hypothetical protein